MLDPFAKKHPKAFHHIFHLHLALSAFPVDKIDRYLNYFSAKRHNMIEDDSLESIAFHVQPVKIKFSKIFTSNSSISSSSVPDICTKKHPCSIAASPAYELPMPSPLFWNSPSFYIPASYDKISPFLNA